MTEEIETTPCLIHRIEGYVVDYERYGLENVLSYLDTRYVTLHPVRTETRAVKWHDEHPLNLSDQSTKAFNEMFNKDDSKEALQAKINKLEAELHETKRINTEYENMFIGKDSISVSLPCLEKWLDIINSIPDIRIENVPITRTVGLRELKSEIITYIDTIGEQSETD